MTLHLVAVLAPSEAPSEAPRRSMEKTPEMHLKKQLVTERNLESFGNLPVQPGGKLQSERYAFGENRREDGAE